MTLSRMSLGAKLAIGFGLALVILITIGSVAYHDTVRLVEVTAARARARQFLWNLEQVVSQVRNTENEQRGYLLTGDPVRLEAFRKSIAPISPALRALAASDSSQSTRIEALEPLIAAKIREMEQAAANRESNGLDAAIAEMRAYGESGTMNQIRSAVNEIEAVENTVLAERAAEATATAKRTFWTIGLGTILALLAVSIAAIRIGRGITIPVHELVDTAGRIAAGDLAGRVITRSGDEIGELGRAFNRMAEALESQNRVFVESGTAITGGVRVITSGSDMLLERSHQQSKLTDDSTVSLGNVRDGIEAVFHASEKVSRVTEDSASRALEMQASTEQVRVSMDHLFQSVAKTSASITQTSAASVEMTSMMGALSSAGDEVLSFVSEMDATIAELGHAARSTADLSRRVREEAVAGGQAVDETMTGIEHSSELTQKAASALDDLQRRVGDIGQIVAVIDDVTHRTSLLALNAAIIAAQAGEHGRGFSVVAGEMRELAERTRTSTSEITSIITGVQSGSRDAVRAMEEGVDRIRGTVHVARNATGSLTHIVASAASSFEMAEKISNALEDQSQASRHLHEIASQMAGHIAESSRSIQEQAFGARLLAEEAEQVREIAAQVRGASDQQSVASRDIALAINQIDADARAMRDLLARQLAETDGIASASTAMREIAQQNNTLAQAFTETVRSLARSGEQFEMHVKKMRAPES